MTALIPLFWNAFQQVMGAEEFKRELYRSVLGPSGGRLLDFGCATGHIADAFQTFDYYGVDLDPKAIESASARFQGCPSMRFFAVDIHSRPFAPQFFDDVLFAGTVHHVDDATLKSLLMELHHCTKPGGSIHILDPVLQENDSWQQRLMRRIDRGRYPRTVPQIRAIVDSLDLFDVQPPSIHPTHGALLRDCDFAYLQLCCK